jgi:hypothetical protein
MLTKTGKIVNRQERRHRLNRDIGIIAHKILSIWVRKGMTEEKETDCRMGMSAYLSADIACEPQANQAYDQEPPEYMHTTVATGTIHGGAALELPETSDAYFFLLSHARQWITRPLLIVSCSFCLHWFTALALLFTSSDGMLASCSLLSGALVVNSDGIVGQMNSFLFVWL